MIAQLVCILLDIAVDGLLLAVAQEAFQPPSWQDFGTVNETRTRTISSAKSFAAIWTMIACFIASMYQERPEVLTKAVK